MFRSCSSDCGCWWPRSRPPMPIQLRRRRMTDSPPSRPTDLLNSRGLAAKREYVRGLEQRRDPESLSLLVECLCDESWYLRDLAAQVFVRMGAGAEPVL